MFDKNSLPELAESIVYINFLIALLAIIILYDQRKINQDAQAENDAWKEQTAEAVAALEERIAALEEKMGSCFG